MKPAELKVIYDKTCSSRRMASNQDEFELWYKQLKSYEARDVHAALDEWFSSTATDAQGQLKSRFLPAPAELKALTEAARRRRESDASTPKDYLRWWCDTCRKYCTSFIARGELAPVKNCKQCGRKLTLSERVAA